VEQAPVISRPPAWAPDPWHPGQLRWWDGRQWTPEVRPLHAPPGGLHDPSLRWVLPVGRSGFAIAAGYLGLLSVFLVTAPLAVAFGCVALWDISQHPGRLGRGRAIFGIVMGGLFSVLFLALLAQ